MLLPSQLLPYKSLVMARQTRVLVRFPTPQDTEHGDHSLQHPHSPVAIEIEETKYLNRFVAIEIVDLSYLCMDACYMLGPFCRCHRNFPSLSRTISFGIVGHHRNQRCRHSTCSNRSSRNRRFRRRCVGTTHLCDTHASPLSLTALSHCSRPAHSFGMRIWIVSPSIHRQKWSHCSATASMSSFSWLRDTFECCILQSPFRSQCTACRNAGVLDRRNDDVGSVFLRRKQQSIHSMHSTDPNCHRSAVIWFLDTAANAEEDTQIHCQSNLGWNNCEIIYLTVQFVVLFAHTRSSAMRWFRIAARPASSFNGHATRLRASRPWRPVRPTAIHRAICHTCAHTFAYKAPIAWTGIIALTRPTQAAIMVNRLDCIVIVRMLRTIVPSTPRRPTAIDGGR